MMSALPNIFGCVCFILFSVIKFVYSKESDALNVFVSQKKIEKLPQSTRLYSDINEPLSIINFFYENENFWMVRIYLDQEYQHLLKQELNLTLGNLNRTLEFHPLVANESNSSFQGATLTFQLRKTERYIFGAGNFIFENIKFVVTGAMQGFFDKEVYNYFLLFHNSTLRLGNVTLSDKYKTEEERSNFLFFDDVLFDIDNLTLDNEFEFLGKKLIIVKSTLQKSDNNGPFLLNRFVNLAWINYYLYNTIFLTVESQADYSLILENCSFLESLFSSYSKFMTVMNLNYIFNLELRNVVISNNSFIEKSLLIELADPPYTLSTQSLGNIWISSLLIKHNLFKRSQFISIKTSRFPIKLSVTDSYVLQNKFLLDSIAFRTPYFEYSKCFFYQNTIGKGGSLVRGETIQNAEYYEASILKSDFEADFLGSISECIFKENMLGLGGNLVFLTRFDVILLSRTLFIENGNLSLSIHMEQTSRVNITRIYFIGIRNTFEIRVLQCKEVEINLAYFVNAMRENVNEYLNSIWSLSFIKMGICLSFNTISQLSLKNLHFSNIFTKNADIIELLDEYSYTSSEDVTRKISIFNSTFSDISLNTDLFKISTITAELYNEYVIFLEGLNFFNGNLIRSTQGREGSSLYICLLGFNINVLINNSLVLEDFNKTTFSLSVTDLIYIKGYNISINSSIFQTVKIKDIQNQRVYLIGIAVNISYCYFNKLMGKTGGALLIASSGLKYSKMLVNISKSVFSNNKAEKGGAIFFEDPKFLKRVIVEQCQFTGNEADEGLNIYIQHPQKEDNIARDTNLYFLKNRIIDSSVVINEASSFYIEIFGKVNVFFKENMILKRFKGFMIIGQFGGYGSASKSPLVRFEKNTFDAISIDLPNMLANGFDSFSLINLNYFYAEIINCTFRNIEIRDFHSSQMQYVSIIMFNPSNIALEYMKLNNTLIEKVSFTNRLLEKDLITNENFIMALIILSGKVAISPLTNTLFYNLTLRDINFYDKAYNQTFGESHGVIENHGLVYASNIFLAIRDSLFENYYSNKPFSLIILYGDVQILNNTFKHVRGSIAFINASFNVAENEFHIPKNGENLSSSSINILGDSKGKIINNNFSGDSIPIFGAVYIDIKGIFTYSCKKEISIEPEYIKKSLNCRKPFVKTSYVLNLSQIRKNISGTNEEDLDFKSLTANDSISGPEFKIYSILAEELSLILQINKDNVKSNDNVIQIKNNSFLLKSKGLVKTIKYINERELQNDEPFEYAVFGISLEQCPLGSIYNKSINNCTQCSSGSYSISTTEEKCKACPSYANCERGIINPNKNYWRASADSDRFYFCENNPENCLGGPLNLCLRGTTGPKCESCDFNAGYVKSVLQTCMLCDELSLSTFFSIFTFLIRIFFTFYYVYSWLDTINEVYKKEGDPEVVKSKRNLSLYLTTLNFFLQVTALLTRGSKSSSSEAANTFKNIFLALGLPSSVVSYKYCFFLFVSKEYPVYIDLLFIVFFPFVKAIFLMIFISRVMKSRKIICEELARTVYPYANALICLYTTESFEVIFELFSYLSCQTINGTKFMRKDMQISCENELYKTARASIMYPFALLWCVIFPTVIYGGLYINRKKVARKSQREFFLYGSLIIGYSRNRQLWELAKLLSKIWFLMISIFIIYVPARLFFLLLCLGIYGLSVHVFRPYEARRFNTIEKIVSLLFVYMTVELLYQEASVSQFVMEMRSDFPAGLILFFDFLFTTWGFILKMGFVLYIILKIFVELKKKGGRFLTFFRDRFGKSKKQEMTTEIDTLESSCTSESRPTLFNNPIN